MVIFLQKAKKFDALNLKAAGSIRASAVLIFPSGYLKDGCNMELGLPIPFFPSSLFKLFFKKLETGMKGMEGISL